MPVSISGLYELRSSGRRGYAPSGSVTVTFGRPVPFDPNASPLSITSELQDRVGTLQTPARDASRNSPWTTVGRVFYCVQKLYSTTLTTVTGWPSLIAGSNRIDFAA